MGRQQLVFLFVVALGPLVGKAWLEFRIKTGAHWCRLWRRLWALQAFLKPDVEVTDVLQDYSTTLSDSGVNAYIVVMNVQQFS